MQRLEQESLLLRQLAALRHSGLEHGEALALVSPGIVDAGLRARVQAAQDALSSGRPLESDPLLSRGDAPAASLALAAHALDAHLSASASLRLFRSYARLGLLGPLGLLFVLSWVIPLPQEDGLLVSLRWLARMSSLPLMGLGLLLLGVISKQPIPGVRQLQLAASLLQAAAASQPVETLLSDQEDFLYYSLRRERVGSDAAASELAAELSAQGQRTVSLFRLGAPFLAALIGSAILVGVLLLISVPLAGGML